MSHSKSLGFVLDSIKSINSGTVADGEVDMLNYIMHPPSNEDMTMVVTEGLNDETIFRRYMSSFGQGVHHIAFEVDDADLAFSALKNAGISTCSDRVTTDMISGLKQFFIPPEYAGFFVELIERPSKGDQMNEREDASRPNFFSNNSMFNLAQSIRDHLGNESNYHIDDNEEEKKVESGDDCNFCETFQKVGEIAAVQVSVKNIYSSADFLSNILGFRMLRHNKEKKMYLGLPGSSVVIILCEAGLESEERKATVIFNAPKLTQAVKDSINGINGLLLSEEYFSYKVFLAQPSQLSQLQRVVTNRDNSGFDLIVHIKAGFKQVVNFVALPTNLAQWTAHKSVRFSKKKDSWLEVSCLWPIHSYDLICLV